jgi:hypothetical protein
MMDVMNFPKLDLHNGISIFVLGKGKIEQLVDILAQALSDFKAIRDHDGLEHFKADQIAYRSHAVFLIDGPTLPTDVYIKTALKAHSHALRTQEIRAIPANNSVDERATTLFRKKDGYLQAFQFLYNRSAVIVA